MYRGNEDSLLRDAQFLLQQPEPTFKNKPSIAPSPANSAAKNFKSRSRFFKARDGVKRFAYTGTRKVRRVMSLTCSNTPMMWLMWSKKFAGKSLLKSSF
jgi:hypothetical protein